MRNHAGAMLAVVAVGLLSFVPRVHAGTAFVREKVDSTTMDLNNGRLLRMPNGDLLATVTPATARGASASTMEPIHEPVRFLVRHDGEWSQRASVPPQDSCAQHDLVCDSNGKLYFLNWQGPGSNECRPLLQEEVGGEWVATVLDTGTAWGGALAIDANGEPWVAMLRQMRSGFHLSWAVIVQHRTSQGWSRDSLAIPELPSRLVSMTGYPFALDGTGQPHFLFTSASGACLLRAARKPTGWEVDTVSTAGGGAGIRPQLVLAPNGTMNVVYAEESFANNEGAKLWLARESAGGWARVLVADDAGEHAAALAFDHAGRPRIAYSVPQQYLNSWEYSSGALCYMVPDGASWARTFVNSDSGYNFSPQLLLDQNDQPLILMNDPSLRLPFLATTIGVAGVAPDAGARAFALEYAAANPGRVGARHRWAIRTPVAAVVSLAIYDPAGRRLCESDPRSIPAGRSIIEWTPEIPAPGCYFVSARIGDGRTDALRVVLNR